MRRVVFLVGVAAALLMTDSASAAPKAGSVRLEAELRVAPHVVIGDRYTTGGVFPQAFVRGAWSPYPWLDLHAGAGFGVLGPERELRDVGFLGGPEVGARARPWAGPVAVGLSVAFDIGRMPVCNEWGLCPRFVGIYPATTLSVGYETAQRLAFGGTLTMRHIETLAWTGQSWEPAVVGRFWF